VTGPLRTIATIRSGTSMTRSDVLPRTYATLRFAGDQLDPEHISRVLPVMPKRSHRMGEMFYAGPHAGHLKGRTGIWYFDTRDIRSDDLADHLRYIVKLLYPDTDNSEFELYRQNTTIIRRYLSSLHKCTASIIHDHDARPSLPRKPQLLTEPKKTTGKSP
jgi:hypothetical protein